MAIPVTLLSVVPDHWGGATPLLVKECPERKGLIGWQLGASVQLI